MHFSSPISATKSIQNPNIRLNANERDPPSVVVSDTDSSNITQVYINPQSNVTMEVQGKNPLTIDIIKTKLTPAKLTETGKVSTSSTSATKLDQVGPSN